MSRQVPIQDGRVARLAPLHFCDIPAIIPDQYVVYLAPGHTLDEHKQRVNMDALSDAITFVFDKLFPDKICYGAQLDAGLLAGVRADQGVELVECDTGAQAALEA